MKNAADVLRFYPWLIIASSSSVNLSELTLDALHLKSIFDFDFSSKYLTAIKKVFDCAVVAGDLFCVLRFS